MSNWKCGPSGNILKPAVLAQYTKRAVGSSGQRQRHAEPATRNLGAIINMTHYLNISSSVTYVSYYFAKMDGMAAVQHRLAELAGKI